MVQVTNTLQGMSPNHHAQVLIRDFGPSIKGKEASSRKPCKGQHVDIQTVIWIHAQVVVGTAEHKPQNVFAVDCFSYEALGLLCPASLSLICGLAVCDFRLCYFRESASERLIFFADFGPVEIASLYDRLSVLIVDVGTTSIAREWRTCNPHTRYAPDLVMIFGRW